MPAKIYGMILFFQNIANRNLVLNPLLIRKTSSEMGGFHMRQTVCVTKYFEFLTSNIKDTDVIIFTFSSRVHLTIFGLASN